MNTLPLSRAERHSPRTLGAYAVRKLGQHRGAPRLWLEGREPAKAGFEPGSRYTVSADPGRALLVLEIDEAGQRTVSGKQRGDATLPVIDINSKELLAAFAGLESVRVIVESGRISIVPVASEQRARERLDRLREKLATGQPLATGSVASGIGILDRAAHEGLLLAGVETRLAFANEIREDCVDHMVERNPIVDDDAIMLNAPLQEVAFDSWVMERLPNVDVLVGGIPCSAASRAGKATRGSGHAEADPIVGHLVVGLLAFIAKTQPAAFCLENIPTWGTSASMHILRNQLTDLGYVVHETHLRSSEWNTLENRERLCVVAVTKGIDFSFDSLERPAPMQRRFAEIMESVPLDSESWGKMQYLKDKRVRDEAAGKNFKMRVIDAQSTEVGTLNKTLWKRQSTGTFIQHPEDPDLLRLPTVPEHARAKEVWPEMVEGLGTTFGHEVLGQSVCVPPFVAVFKLLGYALQAFAREASTAIPSFVRGSGLKVA